MYTGVAIFALTLGCTAALIQCPPNYCETTECERGLTVEFCSAQGAMLKERSSFCGCCDTCVGILKKDENCLATMLLGIPARSQCDEGLYCDSKSLTCQPEVQHRSVQTGPCVARRHELTDLETESMKVTGERLLGLTLPECSEDGSYAGKQCTGSQCYCVREDGSSIDGYSHYRWLSKHISCECARQLDSIKTSGLIGRTLSCDEFGDFNGVQCAGSVCYCVDKAKGSQVGTSSISIGEIDSLNC